MIAFGCLIWFVLTATAAETRALSLEEALQLAAANDENLRLAALGVDRAEADQDVARGGYLPQVGGSISYNHIFVSEYDALFDTGGASAAVNPFADLPFGAADTWRVDLSASQVVYGGGRVRAQGRLAESGQELAEMNLRSSKAAAQLDVAAAYLDAALAARVVEIAESGLARAELTLEHARAAAAVGRQPEFEVLRAAVEVDSQRVVVIQQRRVAALAELRLKQIVGLGNDTALTLTSSLDAAPVEAAAPEPSDRVALAQARATVDLAEASLDLTRSAARPQVAISAAAGLVAYPDNPLPPTEDWRPNVSAGASVSMPLFSGGVLRAQVRGARVDLAQAELRARQAIEATELDTLDALAGLEAADAQWTATAASVEQAERAYAIAEVRFREGISPQSELADARLLLQRAQATRAQAGRDLQIAALRVELLSELPLSVR